MVPPLKYQRLSVCIGPIPLAGEMFNWIFPVVLGSGTRLYGEGAEPLGLELIDLQTSSTAGSTLTEKP